MINTQTQIDSLIDLAVLQRTELKQLVDSLPQLRDHLSSEIERNLEEIEPAIRSELEQFVAARALDTQAKTSAELSAKLDAMARNLESTTAAKYSVLMAERAQNATLLAQAEARIAEAASALPGAVKGIVTDELARFPRAGEIDQLRKEFAEPRGLNPRGRWQVGETYNKLDLVSYNGDSYVSNTNGNREKPSRSSEAWTLSAARGNGGAGGGVTSLTDLVAVPANGELLIGNGSAFVNSTLTAGTGVTITNGPGTITIDASGAQEVLTATVTNAESFAITRGQVVYLFGATGNRASVKLADNTSDAASSKTFGVVSEASIAAGANGLITCVGTVDKLALGSYTEGDVLYLGATPGAVTNVKPYAPNHLVYVGMVERANNGNGELYVRIQNGFELDEIHDVQITTPPLAGALLMRDATNSLWKANRLTGTANQVTVTNADTAVTLSLPTTIANVNSVTAATTQNLTLAGGSTGATVVIGQGTTAASATITPTGTGNLLLQTNAQIPTTGCFQINNTSGAAVWQAFTSGATTMASFSRSSNALLIKGGGGAGAQVSVGYTGEDLTLAGGSTGASLVLLQGANGAINITSNGSGSVNVNPGSTGSVNINSASGVGKLAVRTGTNENAHFRTATAIGGTGVGLDMLNDASGATVGFTLRSSATRLTGGNVTVPDGNLLIGTTTDGGQKLQVNGTASFAGAVTVTGSGSSSDSFKITGDTAGIGLQVGTTGTVNLYRAAADKWATDDAFSVGGAFTPLGNIYFPTNSNLTSSGSIGTQASAGLSLWSKTGSIYDFTIYDAAGNLAVTMPTGTRNLSIASTTPSTGAGSGALQVAGGIYSGANSVFAGDRLLARKDQNAVTRLQVRNDTSGTSAQSQVSATLGDFTTYTAMGSLSAGFTTSGLFAANAGYIASNAAAGLNLFTVGATSLTLGTNSTAALTLASTGAATFAGAVTVNGGSDLFQLNATSGSGVYLSLKNSGTVFSYIGEAGSLITGYSANSGTLGFRSQGAISWSTAGATEKMSLSTGGVLSVSGAIAIGNTVATAAGVASTHKVTMVIGGVTYYLLASNV